MSDTKNEHLPTHTRRHLVVYFPRLCRRALADAKAAAEPSTKSNVADTLWLSCGGTRVWSVVLASPERESEREEILMRRFKLLAVLSGVYLGLVCAAVPALAAPLPNVVQCSQNDSDTYSQDDIVRAVASFFGVTAEAAGTAVERIFKDNGRPNGYIKGSEGAGAIGVGLRYGEGTLQMKSGATRRVYWQGPSVGFDLGGNGSKVFTLVYNLPSTEAIFQRFPGVEGSAYFVAGIGVNYQRANDITLAPMRAGVGWRLGANVGYLAYTKKRHVLPF